MTTPDHESTTLGRQRRGWSWLEIRNLRTMAGKLNTSSIAEILGRTPRGVRHKACDLCISLRVEPPAPPPAAVRAPTIPFTAILQQVAEKHAVPIHEITGARRTKRIAYARQEVMYRARAETRLSTPQIGMRLGGRDHTTVIYGIAAFARRTGYPYRPKRVS